MNKSVVEVDSFLIDQTDQGKSPNTVTTYRRVLDAFAKWLGSNGGDIADLTRTDVQSYVNTLENDGKSAATVDKVFACISVYARFIGRNNATDRIKRVPPLKVREVAPKSLEENDIRRLRREAERDANKRDIAIVNVLLLTGVRVAELCDLNRSDAVINERSGWLSVRGGKGDKSRKIPLSSDVRYHLARYLAERTDSDPALFVSNYRQRISPRTVQHMLRKYDTHPHELRHTFVRRLVASGVDIATAAELAGHADINVTRMYSKPSESELQNAIDRAFS